MPILGITGSHLRGPYTVVGKDSNNNIFPVSWVVVEIENVEGTWFLDLLVKDIESVKDPVTWSGP